MKAYRSKRRIFLSALLHSFLLLLLCFTKGWTLPENEGNTAGGYNNSYGNLLYKEGVITSQTSQSYTTGGFQKLTSPPLSFVMSGDHNPTSTTLNYRGSRGYYRSKNSASLENTYYLEIRDSSTILPRATWTNKPNGFSLRCVAW